MTDDWLSGALPGIIVKEALGEGHALQTLFTTIITYGGVLFDLAIGFLLWNGRTRLLGFVLVLIFNTMNGLFLFNDIGVFPVLMVLASILFFDPDKVEKWVGKMGFHIKKKKNEKRTLDKKKEGAMPTDWPQKHHIIAGLLGLFMLFHLLFPLRHYLLTDNPEWTGIASRFAWRMKMQSRKITEFKMTLKDGVSGVPTEVDHASFVTANQKRMMINDPRLIAKLAKYLRRTAIGRGMADPIVKAAIMVYFNARPAQLMIDPAVDLSRVDERDLSDVSWIVPLKED